MPATLTVRNASSTNRFVRRDALERLANRICEGEKIAGIVEISLLLCDDEFMSHLNHQYRRISGPTDVLSFEQENPPGTENTLLGDIVISIETALRQCGGDRPLTRKEVELLFCHGMLHLLGYNHSTERDQKLMRERQAQYLGVPEQAAWPSDPTRKRNRPGRTLALGR